MGTPLDEFEEMTRYRDVVRTSLMETQLDDRHDLSGNTIYRLNFATVVIPERASRKLAGIVVTLKESGNSRKTLWDDVDTRYSDLLEDWKDELQRQVIELVDDRVASIDAGRYLPPEDQAAFERFLLLSFPDVALADPEKTSKFTRRYLEREADAVNSYFRTLFGGELGTEHELGTEQLSSLRNYCRSNSSFAVGAFGRAFPRSANDQERHQCRAVPDNAAFLSRLDLAGVKQVLSAEPRSAWSECVEDSGARLSFIEHVVLGDHHESTLGDHHESTGCGQTARRLHEFRERLGVRTIRHNLVAEFVAHNLEERVAKTRFYEEPVSRSSLPRTERGDYAPTLGSFFELTTDHCAHGTCYPLVTTTNTPGQRKMLRDLLERDARLATYALAPGEAGQRLGLLERQVLGFALGTTNAGAWTASGEAVLGAAALERQPFVLSIGDTGREEGTDHAMEMRFAWVVLPRRQASDIGLDAQKADHVSMSAVVSVPSWWKSMELGIETCWLTQDRLRETLNPSNLCREADSTRAEQILDVALPGDASEIMSKLRFEVLTFPYVFGRQPQQELEVGRPGTLTLLGGRLWRSPTVIMGSQQATRIEVLPDMKGIIAHFECVYPSPGTQGSSTPPLGSPVPTDPSDTQTRAVIWTSEGKTAPLYVSLKPFVQRAGEETVQPCWLNDEDAEE